MHFRSSLLLLLSHQAAGRWMARTAAMPPNLTCSGLTSTRFASVVGLWLPGATFQGHDVHMYVLRRQCLQDSKRRQKGKRLARNATRPEDWRRSVWSLRTSGPRCLCPTRAGRPLERSLHVMFRVPIMKSRCLPPTYLPACLPACLPTYLPTYLPTCLPAYLPTCLPAYLPACLPTHLLTHACLPACLPTYLPTYIHKPRFLSHSASSQSGDASSCQD